MPTLYRRRCCEETILLQKEYQTMERTLDQVDVVLKAKTFESLLNLINTECSYDEYVQKILGIIQNALTCEAGSIFELDSKQKTLAIRAATGQGQDQLATVIVPLGKGVVGHVAETMTPVLVNNVFDNTMHMKAISNLTGLQVNSLIATPLLIRGQVYGVIELLNKNENKSFEESDLEFLSSLAQIVSKLLEVRMVLNWASNQAAA